MKLKLVVWLVVIAGLVCLVAWVIPKLEALAPWLALIAGLVCLVACVVGKKDKLWFWGLAVLTAIVFGIACTAPRGPGLLVSKKYPTETQKAKVGEVFSHLLYGTNTGTNTGTNAPTNSVSETKPLPPKRGKWGWWKSFFILTPFVILCGLFAFTEKIEGMLEERKIRKEHEKNTAQEGHAPVASKEHFWLPDAWDILSMGIEIVRLFKGRK